MTILQNLNSIQNDIIKYSPCPEKVKLIGASKKQTLSKITTLIDAGLTHFAENYLQEADDKFFNNKLNVSLHYIGKIQSKKIPKLVGAFNYIQSIENYSQITAFELQCKKKSIYQKILLQWNIANEETKSGAQKSEIPDLINHVKNCQFLQLCGLMLMPPVGGGYFKKAQNYFLELKNEFPDMPLSELSMGTSHDYKEALKFGSTMIRVGTNLFGPRGEDK